MNNRNIKDVFFDLDHTLWDFDRNSRLAFKRVFDKSGIDLDLPRFFEVYEPINFQYWKLYREERVTKQQLRRGRFKDAFVHFNMKLSNKQLDELATSYIDELPINNYLFDGTKDLLEYLVGKYRLHIITNGFGEVQHLKLKNSGIEGYFETVTTSEEVGVKKPNPAVFKRALRKANAEPKTSIMIGDTFEADILGAEGVGMETLFFNYRAETVPAKYVLVDSIIEIKNHL